MTREEAIKEAYGIPVTKAQHEALQILIPELAENDDDRIREYVIRIVKDWWRKIALVTDDGKFPTEEEMLAYLEKQKEQNIYKSSKSEIDFADRYSKDVWEKLMSKFKAVEGYSIGCNDVSDIVLNAILNAFKWQKEQKPDIQLNPEEYINDMGGNGCYLKNTTQTSAWSEDVYSDEKQKEQNHTRNPKIYDSMDVLIADALIEEIEASELPESAKYNRIYWVKKHRQKPSEWSEEDINLLNRTSSIIRWASHSDRMNKIIGDEGAIELEDWLKNLPNRINPQPKMEWSEEEQQTISFAVDWLTKMLERTDVPEAKRDIESVILGLKSLRSQPKQELRKEEIEHLYALASFIKSKGYEDDGEFLEGVADKLKMARKETE